MPRYIAGPKNHGGHERRKIRSTSLMIEPVENGWLLQRVEWGIVREYTAVGQYLSEQAAEAAAREWLGKDREEPE